MDSSDLNPKAKFYHASILSEDLATIFEEEKPDIVNHHAAHTVVPRSVDDPRFDAEQNIIGSINVIQNCIRFGVKKIVYASSGGALYGEIHGAPAHEGSPVGPISPYGISKLAAENYIVSAGRWKELNWTILRYANVYGPRQNSSAEGGVIAIFMSQMASGNTPRIFGDGEKTRDYVFVTDVARANLLAMNPDNNNRIYNIGTGVETKDIDIFEKIARLTGFTGKPKFVPTRPGELQRSVLDCTKAMSELKWYPTIGLSEGLKLTSEVTL